MFNIINIVNNPSEIKRASALSQPTVQPETTVQDVFTVNHCCDPDESPPETSGESNNPADETDIQQFGLKAKKQQNHYHSELCPVGPRSQRSGRSNPAQRNNHKSFFWGYRTKFIHTSSLHKYICEVFVVYLRKKKTNVYQNFDFFFPLIWQTLSDLCDDPLRTAGLLWTGSLYIK